MIMKLDVDISGYSEKEIWDILDCILDAKPKHLQSWLTERNEYLCESPHAAAEMRAESALKEAAVV